MIVAIVPAAGKVGDHRLQPTGFRQGEQPWPVVHLIRLLTQNQRINETIVVVDWPGSPLRDALAELEVSFVTNPQPHRGTVSSIQTAVMTISSHIPDDGVLIVLPEQVSLRPETLDKLIDAFVREPGNIVIPTYQDRYGLPLLVSCRFLDHLLTLNSNDPLDILAKQLSHSLCKVAVDDPAVLENIEQYLSKPAHRQGRENLAVDKVPSDEQRDFRSAD